MRVYEIKRLSWFYPLTLTLSRRERGLLRYPQWEKGLILTWFGFK
jgi:hypothetical protein